MATLAILLAMPAAAAELTGIVTQVHNGDTLTRSSKTATYKIRLTDIDASELKQPRCRDAAASLAHLCTLRRAVAETAGEDRDGRTLARVTCAGLDANAEQVRRGWAWAFIRYALKDSPLYRLEAEARGEKRGLWADDEPVPPWDWRKMQR